MTSKDNPYPVTRLLQDWQGGDEAAGDALFSQVYVELETISAALLRREHNASLSTGDLVSEAALRLINLNEINWASRAHFLAFTARIMRRVLVDHARARNRHKRGHIKVTLLTQIAGGGQDALDLEQVEKGLIRLSAIDPERGSIVELRYYGGLSFEETAEALGISVSTCKRKWRSARAWLLQAIDEQKKMQDLS